MCIYLLINIPFGILLVQSNNNKKMDTKIELMETRFLKENGGYLTMENVVEIGKLKRLGTERLMQLKPLQPLIKRRL